MNRIRLGVCIADHEYCDRITLCLAKHYREQLELHMFSEPEMLWESAEGLDAILMGDCGVKKIRTDIGKAVFYLCDEEPAQEPEGDVFFVEKYQEVNKIVDEIMRHVGEEIESVQQGTGLTRKSRALAVYSLSENEYQLPLAVTLASILSENEHVLLLDLQENSGISQIAGTEGSAGLEELLVMAESGRYSSGRMLSCIGHVDGTDYVYPADNTECLCETSASTYQSLIQVLSREMGYQTIILNLGSRFMGFFDALDACQEVYLVRGHGGLAQWRQREFMSEAERHGGEELVGKIREIDVPIVGSPSATCERLVEQWKWNELGDSIRGMIPRVAACG
ncbi:MAG: hypothetical protein LUI02_05965 [Clostridiales bacterium]|nr:hypothetical protein [Clostridiales bacterium]